MSDEREHEGEGGRESGGEGGEGGGEPRRERAIGEEHIERVRVGHGANCSSIGSVIDTLFATATVGAAVFAAIVAALKKEEVRVAGGAAATAGAHAAGEKEDA